MMSDPLDHVEAAAVAPPEGSQGQQIHPGAAVLHPDEIAAAVVADVESDTESTTSSVVDQNSLQVDHHQQLHVPILGGVQGNSHSLNDTLAQSRIDTARLLGSRGFVFPPAPGTSNGATANVVDAGPGGANLAGNGGSGAPTPFGANDYRFFANNSAMTHLLPEHIEDDFLRLQAEQKILETVMRENRRLEDEMLFYRDRTKDLLEREKTLRISQMENQSKAEALESSRDQVADNYGKKLFKLERHLAKTKFENKQLKTEMVIAQQHVYEQQEFFEKHMTSMEEAQERESKDKKLLKEQAEKAEQEKQKLDAEKQVLSTDLVLIDKKKKEEILAMKKDCEDRLETLTKELTAEKTAELETLKAELTHKLAEETTRAEAQLAEAEQAHAAHLEKLTTEHEQAKQEGIEAAQAQCEERLAGEREVFRREKEKLQEDLIEEKQNADIKINALQVELTEKNQNFDQASIEVEQQMLQFQEQVQQLQDEKQFLQTDFDQLKLDLEKAESDNAQEKILLENEFEQKLERSLGEERKKLEQKVSQIESEFMQQFEMKEQEALDLQKELDLVNKECNELKEKVDSMEVDKTKEFTQEDLEKRIAEEKEQWEMSRAMEDQAKRDNLEHLELKHSGEIHQLQQELQRAKEEGAAKVSQLEQQLDSLRHEREAQERAWQADAQASLEREVAAEVAKVNQQHEELLTRTLAEEREQTQQRVTAELTEKLDAELNEKQQQLTQAVQYYELAYNQNLELQQKLQEATEGSEKQKLDTETTVRELTAQCEREKQDLEARLRHELGEKHAEQLEKQAQEQQIALQEQQRRDAEATRASATTLTPEQRQELEAELRADFEQRTDAIRAEERERVEKEVEARVREEVENSTMRTRQAEELEALQQKLHHAEHMQHMLEGEKHELLEKFERQNAESLSPNSKQESLLQTLQQQFDQEKDELLKQAQRDLLVREEECEKKLEDLRRQFSEEMSAITKNAGQQQDADRLADNQETLARVQRENAVLVEQKEQLETALRDLEGSAEARIAAVEKEKEEAIRVAKNRSPARDESGASAGLAAASSSTSNPSVIAQLEQQLQEQEQENQKLRTAAKTLLEENDELKERELPDNEQIQKLYHRNKSKQEEIELLRLTIQTKEEALQLTLEETTKLQPKLEELETEKKTNEAKIAQLRREYADLLESVQGSNTTSTDGGQTAQQGGTIVNLVQETLAFQLRNKSKELEHMEKLNKNTIDKQYVTNILLKFINADPDTDTETRLEMGRLLAESLDWDRAKFANLLKATGSY
ncbi:unnamed protein product [Amoebophrya sp. A120]|nr:unnamed protein product [Amoebophrya sp. A120]|eukprot:GSA120T00020740001.1